MSKLRARDLGIPVAGKTGPLNAITDVEGVKVGYTTLTDPAKNMRTGVSAILPRGHEKNVPTPVWAGQFDLNGNGEMTGTHWINDARYFIGPICITDTHGVGAVHTLPTNTKVARAPRPAWSNWLEKAIRLQHLCKRTMESVRGSL